MDGPIKSKEVQQAEKIYTTLRECREQVGLNKMKGEKNLLFFFNLFPANLENVCTYTLILIIYRSKNAILLTQKK